MTRTCILLIFLALTSWCGLNTAVAAESPATLERIIDGIEQRYVGKGFSANFFQESLLKAMQITDTAEGHLTVKRPGKMHWKYTMPDEQTIVSDGASLWIYRPADRQVMVGKAPEFFKGGKGAGFLSDIRQIRNSFKVQLVPAENEAYYRLQLTPLTPTPDVSAIVLSVAKATFTVDQVVTHNVHGDETRIVMSDYRFSIDPDEALFRFSVPKGVDVVHMDQP